MALINIFSSTCWPVIFTKFLNVFFIIGTIKSMGVLLVDMSVSLKTTSTDIGIILGLFNAFCFLPAPFIVPMFQRCRPKHRSLCVVGAIMVSFGVLLAAFVSSNAQLAVLLSLSGLGYCIITVSCTLLLNEHAGDHFNLFFGLSSIGGGVGMVLLPVLAEILRTAYGWRGALLVLSGIMANLIPSTAAIKPQIASLSHDEESERENARLFEETTQFQAQSSLEDEAVVGVHSSEGAKSPSDQAEENVVTGGHALEETVLSSQALMSKVNDNMGEHEDFLTLPCANEEKVNLPCRANKGRDVNYEVKMLRDERHDFMLPSAENIHGVELPIITTDNFEIGPCAENDESSGRLGANSLIVNKVKGVFLTIQESLFVTEPLLNCLLFAVFFGGIVFNGWHSFLIPLVLQRGVALDGMVAVTFVAAAGNIAGRSLAGILTHGLFRPINLYLALTIINTFALLCLAMFPTIYAMVVPTFLSSYILGNASVLDYLVLREQVSAENFATGNSAFEVFFGVGTLFGGYLTGLMADVFLNYSMSYMVLAGMNLVMVIFLLPLKIFGKPGERERDGENG